MSNNKSTYDYGKCHVCGEQMKERNINQDFWLKGKLIVIESVPAGVCPQCGEKTVKADVGRQLASLIQNLSSSPKGKTIAVPVVRYAKGVTLAKQNTPTRVIGLRLGRTTNTAKRKASEDPISLNPTNQPRHVARKK